MAEQVTVSLPAEITKQIVEGQIKAAVMTALTKDPEALIAAVVKAAMKEQAPGSYNRETIWDQMINETIRNAARDSFKEWLDENALMVKRRVREMLESNKTAFVERIVEGMVTAAQTGFHFSVHIKDRE